MALKQRIHCTDKRTYTWTFKTGQYQRIPWNYDWKNHPLKQWAMRKTTGINNE